MATLDQLPAEQRAIVELVVQRGRSYGALAEVLQVPSERVRELARDALVELSPRTAERVDAGWRGQVADYLLGQQAPEEARATRDYLKRSESARAWALSLLDSLDPLYPNGASPPVPEGGAPAPAPEPEPEPEVEKEEEKPAAATAEERIRERARKKPAAAEEAEDEDEDEVEEKPKVAAKPKRAPARLSPEAQAAVRRRRVILAVAGVAALAAITVAILAIAGVFSSDDNGGSADTGSSTTSTTGTSTTPGQQQPIQVLGQIAMQPIGKTKAQGIAYLVSQGDQKFVVVQAQVPPLPRGQKVAAYEVWLYNSNGDARSLGAQYTDTRGILQGRAPLPADYQKFKSIDISRELFDKNTGHSNNSVLRGAFASLKPVPQQQQGTGTTTTPSP